MESMTDALPFQTQQPIFSKVGGISELSHMNDEERYKYFKSLNKYRTNLSVMEYATEEGIEKGRAEGRAEGRTEGEQIKAIEIARLMSQEGEPIEKIARYTGLSIDILRGILSR